MMSATPRLTARHLVLWAAGLDKQGRLNVEAFQTQQLLDLVDAVYVANFGKDPHLSALNNRVAQRLHQLQTGRNADA